MAIITRSGKGAPLSAADHDKNMHTLYRGYESVKAHGALGNGSTNDRAAFVAADTAAAGKAIMVPPGTYRITSNLELQSPLHFASGAKLLPNNGVTIHLVGGYEAGDWDHVFDISAGGKVTGEALGSEYLTPQHFGATASGLSGNDTAAIQAAVRYGTFTTDDEHVASTLPVMFPTPKGGSSGGFYHINNDIVVNRTVRIFGQTPIGLSSVVIRVSKPAVAGFWFAHPADNGGAYATAVGSNFYGASGSQMSDLIIWATGFQTGTQTQTLDWSQSPAYGIVHNCRVNFYNIMCQGFELANFFAHAQSTGNAAYGSPINPATPFGTGTMYGDVTGSIYEKCNGEYGRGPGFAAQGDRAYGVLYDTCDATQNRSAGYYDNSSLGCTYLNCHTAQNTFRVNKNGTGYMCIKLHTSSAASEPAVGSDWERYWVAINTTYNVNWTSGVVYTPAGSINNSKTEGQYTTIISCYTEGGIELGLIPRGDAVLVGGLAVGSGRVLRHPEFNRTALVGNTGKANPQGWQVTTGGATMGSSLGKNVSAPPATFFQFGTTADDPAGPETARVDWNSVGKRYDWLHLNKIYMSITGNGWTGANYSGAGRLLLPDGMVLGNGSSSFASPATKISAIDTLAGLLSSLNGQAVVRGQIWFYANAAAGGWTGAVCTTAGTVGSTAVIKNWGPIDN